MKEIVNGMGQEEYSSLSIINLFSIDSYIILFADIKCDYFTIRLNNY